MKARVLLGELVRSLGNVGRVTATRGQLPVLANALIEANKEGVSLAGTNLELGMRVGVGGKVTEEGAVTVPARNLAEFVSSMTGEEVSLETEGEKLKVRAGKFEGTFAGIAASEFPIMPRLGAGKQGTKSIKIGRGVIEEISREVAFAAATDESRPVLTGIKFQVTGDNLVVVATDGFRLSRKQIASNIPEAFNGLILPARTVIELARVVTESGEKGEVTAEVVKENNQVVFGVGRVEMVSRVLEGNFPDVDKIIPTEHRLRLTIDREELVRAVRAAAIFARESSNIVRFKVTGSRLVVRAAASQTGESEVELEGETEGEDMEMAFNFRFVMDYLSSTDAERVVVQSNGSLAPGVWRAEKKEDLIHLIMPVRV